MDSIKIFFPSQLVHAPPVQLGFPSIHSFLKEHSLRASPSLETGAKTDPGLGDDIENEGLGFSLDLSLSFNLGYRVKMVVFSKCPRPMVTVSVYWRMPLGSIVEEEAGLSRRRS